MKLNQTRCPGKPLFRPSALQAYAMLLPAFLGLSLFVLYPLGWTIRYCLFRYDGYMAPIYVGLRNFIRIFTNSPRFWESVANTFIFALGKLSVELPLALSLAYFLNQKLRGRNILRAVFFLPTIISVAIIGIVFSYLFAAHNGVINAILMRIGLMGKEFGWFSLKWPALAVVALASIWQNFGLNMIFFLTGLQSIPTEVYESADIDGVNAWQKFYRITLPMLGPVLVTVVMLALLGSLKVTDLVLVLTNGAPGGHTEVMMTYVYNAFFESGSANNYGYGAALVVVSAVILGIVTFAYLRVTRRASEIY